MSSCSLLPSCFECARLRGVVPDIGWACDAFTDGIPTDILASVVDHRHPYDGDGGLTFEPKSEAHDADHRSIDKQSARYQDESTHSGQCCAACTMFESPDGCSLVEGDISPDGWCQYYEPESESEDVIPTPKLAEDPPVSEAQRRAMWAAKSGHSTLGIPQSVGSEFAEADPGGHLPEKVGKDLAPEKFGIIQRALGYMREFFGEEEAEPEHEGEDEPFEKVEHSLAHRKGVRDPKALAAWIGREHGKIPSDESEETKKRHEGKLSERTREEIGRVGSAHREDMPDSDFLLPSEKKYPVKKEGKYDRGLLLAAAREARMHGHKDLAERADKIREREFGSSEEKPAAVDMAIDWDAVDWRGTASLHENCSTGDSITSLPLWFAFDRESVRKVDGDGMLHVSEANISKANVCPYYGAEINAAMEGKPGWKPLDSERKYMLLRHPDELKKAEKTWDGKPILNTHVPATATDFPKDQVIGTVGSEGKFREPYLQNSLVFWPQAAIDEIEGDFRKQLSAGYKYTADMTPGTYKGVHFDGVMRNLCGNHLALVREGRAGADVVVGDSADSVQWMLLEEALLGLTELAA